MRVKRFIDFSVNDFIQNYGSLYDGKEVWVKSEKWRYRVTSIKDIDGIVHLIRVRAIVIVI